MLVRVLGTVDVVDDRGNNVSLGGPTQRRLLAVLAAQHPSSITVDDIITQLWSADSRPTDPVASVRTYVARIRSALGSGAVVTGTGSYTLGEVETDAERFAGLVEQARRSSGAPSVAEIWRQSLDLWRGEAYDPFTDLDLVRPEAARLEELKAEATEAWFDARLAVGEGRELTADIETAITRHPLREGFRAQHLTVLAKAGRHPEALRSFQEFRADLTEIGLQPSSQLAELDRQIAAGDTPATGARRTLRGYELTDRIGEGAFAIVHRAVQASVDREVAIKQIRGNLADQPEFIRQFEAEAHLVARLEHPHIVPLYDYWREPGSAYLVMRFLDGGSIGNRLLAGAMELERVVEVTGQVSGALDAAHTAGVIHRDVKPANILLDGAGHAYLSDFGIAVEEAERLDPEAWLSNGSPAYAPPEQLRREPVGPAADVYALGITVYEMLTSRLPFPSEPSVASLLERQLHDPVPLVRATNPDIGAAVDAVIQKATAKRADDRYPTSGAFAADLAAAAGLEGDALLIQTEERNPYKGLQAFDEADTRDFAGRDRLVARLLERLGTHRVVAVVGPSGAGKSSVVGAGLLPALRLGRVPGADRWFLTTMIPGHDPFDDLAAALARIATDPPADLARELRSDSSGLARMIQQLFPDGDELLLVVDQFEELFTLASDDRQTSGLLDGLVAALTVERPQLRLVITLRADFYDRPLSHDGFARLIEEATVPVHPLAADELERAITEPAAAVGARFENGLVAEITADVADQPGALPLLQYTLTELFDRREGDTLTRQAYRDLGGVGGSIARRAEELFEQGSDDERNAVRQTMTRLVTLGEGTEDTRRRVARAELGDDPATAAVVEDFGRARLLSFDRDTVTRAPTVEVGHEALIREWPRFRQWLNDDRDGLRIHRHLTQSAAGWEAGGRPDSELYRGGRLDAATEWSDEHNADLNPTEADFLVAGVARQAAEAEIEAKRVARLRRLLATMAAVAALALFAGGLAWVQQNRASDEADRANQQTAVAEAQTALAEDNAALAEARLADAELSALVSRSAAESRNRPDLGLMLAVAAYEACDGCLEGQSALLAAIGAAPPRSAVTRIDSGTAYIQGRYEELGHGRWIVEVDDGLQLVDASDSSTVVVTDLAVDLDFDFLLEQGRSSPDGRWSALAEEFAVSILETASGGETVRYATADPLVDFRWTPDSESLLVVTADQAGAASVDVVSVTSGQREQRWALPFVPVSWAIGPNGHALLSDRESAGVTVFDLSDGSVGRSYPWDDLMTGQTGFAALDVDTLAFTGFESMIVIDAATEADAVIINPGAEGWSGAGLSADGALAFFGQQSGIQAYDTVTGVMVRLLAPTFERASASLNEDDHFVQFTESGVVEVYDPLVTPNALQTVELPTVGFLSSISPESDLVMTTVPGTPLFDIQRLSTGEEIGALIPDELVEESLATLLGYGTALGDAVGAVLGADLQAVGFTEDGSVEEVVAWWPADEPGEFGRLLAVNQGSIVVGVSTDDTPFSEVLLVIDQDTLRPVGQPLALVDLAAPVYRAAVLPSGSVLAFQADGATSLLSPDGDVDPDVFRLDGRAIQVKTDRDGNQAVILLDQGGAVLVDLLTFEVSEPIPSLPGHRDVRFSQDGTQLFIQDGRARTLLYDLVEGEEVGFLAGGGNGSSAGNGILVTDRNTVWLNHTEKWIEVPLDPERWRAEACRLAGRELSDDEWSEFVPGDQPRRDLCS